MGKGDKRTKRGKIFAGTFGNSRPKNKKKNKSSEKPKSEKSQ
ncbi:MAG: 30S ribosomal protein THX [Ignavibacterium sp.]|nr:30S ribosomal protein THX [Ignavibacterium sp.]MCX7610040.1 30S ribosomal protein THX [Ignavibacterium sp.]MDW8376151.1 30S ribosomal protein THX [Ignavibacteriales bacterium]